MFRFISLRPIGKTLRTSKAFHTLCFGSTKVNPIVIDSDIVGKPDKVDHVFHRAAVMTLLKARAANLLQSGNVPYSDRVFYNQCAKNAPTPVTLAKCVVALLDQIHIQPQNDPSALEKIGELLFGRQYLNLSSLLPSQQPLQKVIPFHLEHRDSYKAAPIAAKEFYAMEEEYSVGRKFGFRPYPVKIKPLIKAQNYFYSNKNLLRRRLKRELSRTQRDLHDVSHFEGLSNLEKIEGYYKMLSHCEAYFKRLNNDNSNYINSNSKLPFKFELRKDKNMTVIENVFEAIGALTGTTKSSQKFSFMSPRLFSVLPADNDKRKHLLSPTLFSFHERDGLFTLPDILKKFNVQKGSEREWLETLLQISGASNTLEKLVEDMEPQMKEMNEKIYPSILELENMEENWRIVAQSYSPEQRKDMKENGYAFLEPDQMQLLYSRNTRSNLRLDYDEYTGLTKEERQRRIDNDIRKLAKLNVEEENKYLQTKRRYRRQTHGASESGGAHGSAEEGHEEHHGPFITLAPFAFGSKIGHGAALEAITLSPHAFFAEVLMPEALILQTLGPRAFIPSILSPSALVGRILSPAAFRAEILSPRALTAFILTPEALIAEILSPKFLDLRVLSPEALIIQVLSPSIIAPRILSPEAGALLILSPSILSPRVLSGHTLTVEVLSPHILGGGHSSHEDHEQGEEHHHKPDEEVDLPDALGHGEHSSSHGHDDGQHAITGQQDHTEIPHHNDPPETSTSIAIAAHDAQASNSPNHDHDEHFLK